MIFDVVVAPASKRFAISVKAGVLRVSLRSEPERNKANIELIKELSKALGRDVRIVSGLSSKRKRLEAQMSAEEWSAFLAGLQPL